MNENNNNNMTPEQDYRESYMPAVHRIGRITMAVAMLLCFLPWLYYFFVKGYTLPMSTYISGISGIAAIGFGMWISEPEAYWPVLGSAGTYIAYLSGNVGGMRFPVATAVQKNLNTDITTPRGQVATVVGIVSSVVVNLIILLAIVLAGQFVISILPETVLSAFGFCVVAMLGSMICMNLGVGKASGSAVVKNLIGVLPYIVIGVCAWLVCNKLFPSLFAWGMAVAVGCSILVGYFIYRSDLKKAEAAEK